MTLGANRFHRAAIRWFPTAQELFAFAAESVAPYKRPRLVRFVEQLPTTSSGKVMRRQLIKCQTRTARTQV